MKRALLLFLMMIGTSSCVYTSFPDLPDIATLQMCPKIELPPAVPSDVYIKIKGDKIEVNEGGEILLRHYTKLRKTIKSFT
jgi:hypothetical protein